MAKRGIINHPKIVRMARRLSISKPHAVGLMECFWQWVAQHCPTGDLSGVDPEIVADAICHPEDAELFWKTLIEVRWVDQTESGAVYVHDWSEHSDDSIHLHIARKKWWFADGSAPRLTRLSSSDRAMLEAFYKGSQAGNARESAQDADKSAGKRINAQESALPLAPCPLPLANAPCPESEDTNDGFCLGQEAGQPNDADPEPAGSGRKSGLKRAPADWPKHWDEFVKIYPMRSGDRGVAKGRDKFKAVMTSGVPPDELIAGVRRYRAWADATANTGTQFIKQIPKWLSDSAWAEPWVIPPKHQTRPLGRGQNSPTYGAQSAYESVMRELELEVLNAG